MRKKLAAGIYAKVLIIALCLLITSCGGSERKFTKHVEKGKEYYASSRYKEAAIEFKNAIQIKPDDAKTHYGLGLAYLKLGGPTYLPAAFKSFSKAAELDPDHLDAQTRIGELFLLSRDVDKAAAQAELVLTKDKGHLDATILLASTKAAKRKFVEAKALLTTLSEAHPESTKPRLALSSIHLVSGDREAAKDVLKKIISTDKSIEPRLALSTVYLMDNNVPAAEETLKNALNDNPGNVTVLSALTNLYMIARKPDMAAQTADKLIAASEERPEGYIILANIQKASGNAAKARETLQRGIERSKDPVQLEKLLAADYLESRQVAEASATVAKILEKNAKDPEGLFLRGRLLLIERKPKEALPDLKAYVDANPRSPFAQYFYGLANMMTGNAAIAKTAFSEAVTVAPRYDEASFMLAVSYLETGEVKLADAQAQKLQSRNPSFPGLSILIGDIRLKQGRHAESVRYFDAYTKGNPQDAKGFAKLAAAHKATGNMREALAAAEKSLSIAPDDEVLALALSIELSSKNFEGALARVNGQISRTPERAVLYLLLGKIHAASNDTAKAEQALKTALAKDDKLYPAYVELGNLYTRKGSIDQAIAQYKESVKVNPKALASYMLIGMLSEKKGDFNGAIDSYKKALEVEPRFAPAANNLAWLYSEKGGNMDVALTLAETAKENAPNEPAISDTLGWIYYKKQAYLKAITLLKESAAKLPNEPAIRYHLGMAYHKKGDSALARQELRKALSIKSDFEGADEARKTLAALK